MSDWWSRKIAGDTAPAQRKPATPPTAPAIRIPAQAPVRQQTVHNQDVLDPTKAPTEQINMGDAIKLWKGGEAMRKEGDMRCPECGSQHVFSRTGRGSNTMINGASPAPRCYECGWNGKYSQADQASWS